MHQNRKDLSRQVRQQAADIDASRPPIRHAHNNEEYSYRDTADAKTPPTLIAMYTKGLPHDPETGLALNPVDYKLFVAGIQSGNPVDFRLTPLGPAKTPANDQQPSQEQITPDSTAKQRQGVWQSDAAKNHPIDDGTAKGAFVRAWESASAGNVFDLEGPDAQSVTMPPAPTLCSDELLAEMVEVYAMALLRDANFRSFPLPKSCGQNVRRRTDRSRKPARLGRARDFDYATDLMVDLPWFAWSTADLQLTSEAERRRRTLADDGSNLFRGSTSGEQVGPYLSQFLLLGNNALGHSNNAPGRLPTDGYALYGSLGIDLRVRIATEARDYLTTWAPFVDVQNGADLRGAETYVDPNPDAGKDPSRGHRFITTPRDLATYVHYDALYEAYLNACVFLLSAGAPFDRGLPFMNADAFDKQQGFAHFGGPHILTLVCEVATRALKAVRYQKFNVHRRLRPEALGGLIDRYLNDPALATGKLAPLRPMMEGDSYRTGMSQLNWSRGKRLMDAIKSHNASNNKSVYKDEPDWKQDSYLLPMAFPEGSPMHPSYGAGHATVAGACVTILKAYFDHGWTPSEWLDVDDKTGAIKGALAYEASNDGESLIPLRLNEPLTIEGELNKLAANIAIGRNWAGVHYYTDYIESIRMGEQIALGLLEEQKLTYPENFTMTVPLFDGGAVRI